MSYYIESDWDRLYWFKIASVRRYPFLPSELFGNVARYCEAEGYSVKNKSGLLIGKKRGLKINITPKFKFLVRQAGNEFEIDFSYFCKMKLGAGIAGAILTFGLTAAMAPISALACYTEAGPFMRNVWRQVDLMVGKPFVIVFENEVLHTHVRNCQNQNHGYPGSSVAIQTPAPSGYPAPIPPQPVYGYPPQYQPMGAFFPAGAQLPPGYTFSMPPPGVVVPPGYVYAIPQIQMSGYAAPPGYAGYPPQQAQPQPQPQAPYYPQQPYQQAPPSKFP